MDDSVEGQRRGSILVVDDTPANLRLLTGMLKEQGYRVRPAPNGRLALQAVRAEAPDLILLDINMPEMNGYETCEALKADEAYADIPVIFISALTETSDKIQAFQTGGVDYVTKPFQFEEVQARVEAHLTLFRLKRELEEKYRQLKELEQLRDSLTHMIVHDLRSPLTGTLTTLQLIKMTAGDRLEEEEKEDV
jgi:two-component system sensor histidine kinase/response regulator